MNRFKGRPAQGLPGALPPGETLLWQGAPDWRALARRAFRLRLIAGYFLVLLAWRVGAPLLNGHTIAFAAASGVWGLVMASTATALLAAFAWLIARTTVYTITSERVVITYGMALPKSLNLPYSRLDAAGLKLQADGTGDIALKLPVKTRLSYLLLWPHVRSGANGRTEPVLRCIPGAEAVAQLLASAIGGLPVPQRAPRLAAADNALAPAHAA